MTQPTQPQPQAHAWETADDDYMPDDNHHDAAIDAEDFLPNSVAQSLAEEELDREHIQGSHQPESSTRRKRRRKGSSNLSFRPRHLSGRHQATRQRNTQQSEAMNEDIQPREEEEESAPHGSRRETLAERREEQQDRIQARLKKKRTHNKALADLDTLDEGNLPAILHLHYTGPMNELCSECQALKFSGETPSLCCTNGKVRLPDIRPPPADIDHMFEGENQLFTLKFIKAMNAMCALGSIGVKESRVPGYNPTYKIEGQMHHKIGSLQPRHGEKPKYMQVYFVHPGDPARELAERLAQFTRPDLQQPDVAAQHQSAEVPRIVPDEEEEEQQPVIQLPPPQQRMRTAVLARQQKFEDYLRIFQEVLHRVNPYIAFMKKAMDLPADQDIRIVLNHCRGNRPAGVHERSLNLPTADEVGAIVVAGDDTIDQSRDIVVHVRENVYSDYRMDIIKTYHRAHDALCYCLLMPYGDDGWQLRLKCRDGRSTLTPTMFYRYHLNIRPTHQNHLLRCGFLTQQFFLDAFVKAETQRLNYIRFHQKELKAASYRVVMDATCPTELANTATKIILPPSVTGSPRYFMKAYQDCMAIVRVLGKPSYFITMTCNTKWREIREQLVGAQRAEHRPDVVARVFHLKVKELLHVLTKDQILGRTMAHSYTIEWQKRGLPHVHLLLWMVNEDKPHTADVVDKAICAELPSRQSHPILRDLVEQFMLHGPCGKHDPTSPCMAGFGEQRKCSKKFPKDYISRTRLDDEQYPVYRRRDPSEGGLTFQKRIGDTQVDVGNNYVVPYNPSLLLKFRCHLNVESVHCLNTVKYIFKYITKGQDQIVFKPSDLDEISKFENGRFISASESVWRLFEFPIHQHEPPVTYLPLHLPGQMSMTFEDEEQAMDAALQGPPETELTAYFDLLASDPTCREMLYTDVCQFFTWGKGNNGKKCWKLRQRGDKNETRDEHGRVRKLVVARLPGISFSAKQKELFHLRTLLTNRPATSFEDLRTYEGVEYPTFAEAAAAMGLSDDDHEQDEALRIAAESCTPYQLRELFATLLISVTPQNAMALFDTHLRGMAEDFLRRAGLQEPTEDIKNRVLLHLQSRLDHEGIQLETLGLPAAVPLAESRGAVIDHELNLIPPEEVDAVQDSLEQRVNQMNAAQRIVFDRVMASVNGQEGTMFSLNACGGSGKTYVLNCILDAVRVQKRVALATATSGIAATLLHGGRTMHSRFKIPINIKEKSFCGFTPGSKTSELIDMADLIVIDEVTMGHRHCFEAVERSIMRKKKHLPDGSTLTEAQAEEAQALGLAPEEYVDFLQEAGPEQEDGPEPELDEAKKHFGRATVVFAGDWRQILPVVPRGNRADIVGACLKKSHLWQHMVQLHMTENVRARLAGGDLQEHAHQLLRLGNGQLETLPTTEFKIRLPDHLILPTGDKRLESLINFVFAGHHHHRLNSDAFTEWITSRAIICPVNSAVERVNRAVVKRLFDTRVTHLYASNSVTGDGFMVQTEFLKQLNPSGFPPSHLMLAVGTSVMLIRNIAPDGGHVNGSRYTVKAIHRKVLTLETPNKELFFLPRIKFITDNDYPFSFIRKQFPIKVCYAVTSNKSQGQTMEKAGIYMPGDFFSHGQLYVAMSRVGNPSNIKILPEQGKFAGFPGVYGDNVVYTEVIDEEEQGEERTWKIIQSLTEYVN